MNNMSRTGESISPEDKIDSDFAEDCLVIIRRIESLDLEISTKICKGCNRETNLNLWTITPIHLIPVCRNCILDHKKILTEQKLNLRQRMDSDSTQI